MAFSASEDLERESARRFQRTVEDGSEGLHVAFVANLEPRLKDCIEPTISVGSN